MKCPVCKGELAKRDEAGEFHEEYWTCENVSCRFDGKFLYPDDVAAIESALSAEYRRGFEQCREMVENMTNNLAAMYPDKRPMLDLMVQDFHALQPDDK